MVSWGGGGGSKDIIEVGGMGEIICGGVAWGRLRGSLKMPFSLSPGNRSLPSLPLAFTPSDSFLFYFFLFITLALVFGHPLSHDSQEEK